MLDLVEWIGTLLREKEMTLVTAESCTGGLLGATITHKPGASEIFERGFVTYSNQSKIDLLNVPEEILEVAGAVSSQTAEAMAKGALENSAADIAVSITGIAGPETDPDGKPAGLVFMGYAMRNGESGQIQHQFDGDRAAIRTQAAAAALKYIISILER